MPNIKVVDNGDAPVRSVRCLLPVVILVQEGNVVSCEPDFSFQHTLELSPQDWALNTQLTSAHENNGYLLTIGRSGENQNKKEET